MAGGWDSARAVPTSASYHCNAPSPHLFPLNLVPSVCELLSGGVTCRSGCSRGSPWSGCQQCLLLAEPMRAVRALPPSGFWRLPSGGTPITPVTASDLTWPSSSPGGSYLQDPTSRSLSTLQRLYFQIRHRGSGLGMSLSGTWFNALQWVCHREGALHPRISLPAPVPLQVPFVCPHLSCLCPRPDSNPPLSMSFEIFILGFPLFQQP